LFVIRAVNKNGCTISLANFLPRGSGREPTVDPIVEHGIQQIRHLDNYVDKLTAWLCGAAPEGRFTIDPAAYGVEEFDARPSLQLAVNSV